MEVLVENDVSPRRERPFGSWFIFELLDHAGLVVGGGKIIAPGPIAAERTASLLLAGRCRVRVLADAPDAVLQQP